MHVLLYHCSILLLIRLIAEKEASCLLHVFVAQFW